MSRIAVFARNHSEYLHAASESAEKSPSSPVTFRSAVRWSKAKKVLDEQLTLQVYFAPTGSKSLVEFEATLKLLIIDPKKGDKDTEAWLAFAPPDTANEGLWESESTGVKTLYIVSNCRRLSKKFSISKLQKASDGKPISENYGYSYVPVLELNNETSFDISPEEIANPEQYFEGATRSTTVNAYERNTVARAACVKYHGHNCSVCGFNFGIAYGQIGEGFIHVHHLTPLSSIKKEYKLDPVKDLIPVCPNCHAMLHMTSPPYSIQELANVLKSRA